VCPFSVDPLFTVGIREVKLKLLNGFLIALIVMVSLILLMGNKNFLYYFIMFLPFLLIILAAALPPRNETF